MFLHICQIPNRGKVLSKTSATALILQVSYDFQRHNLAAFPQPVEPGTHVHKACLGMDAGERGLHQPQISRRSWIAWNKAAERTQAGKIYQTPPTSLLCSTTMVDIEVLCDTPLPITFACSLGSHSTCTASGTNPAQSQAH